MIKRIIIIFTIILKVGLSQAQPVPAVEEKIAFLVTFGKEADHNWGDDDFCQIFFFVVPESQHDPIYIRIFDPDISGDYDEVKLGFNTQTRFRVFGGEGIYSKDDIENKDPVGDYASGTLLADEIFGNDIEYDKSWYTFGPFNPAEGELIPDLGGYIFKVIAEGYSGDDGNLYKYYLSTQADRNYPVEGGNAFTYEYCFRITETPRWISHIYPYVDENVVAIKLHNFDLDDDCFIKIVSVAKKGVMAKGSGDGNWVFTDQKIVEQEKNTSLDIQIITMGQARNNNIVFYVTNQYDQFLPFYTVPIGGVPKYDYKIKASKTKLSP